MSDTRAARGSWRARFRARWGLAALAVLGAALTVKALLSDLLLLDVFVDDVKNEQVRRGFADFGAQGVALAVGIVLVVLVTGLALVAPGRARAVLSLLGLGLVAALLVDLALIGQSVVESQNAAAADVVRVMATLDGQPQDFGFRSSSPALYAAGSALGLFGLVFAQLPRPEWGVWTQAAIGALLGLVALPLPWARGWIATASGYETHQVWLWSLGGDGYGPILELAVLIALVLGALRAPGYRRHWWAIGSGLVATWLFLSVLLAQVRGHEEIYAQGGQHGAVLGMQPTDANTLLAVGAVLLGVAAARAAWHGRGDAGEPTPGDRWLPQALDEPLRR